MKRLALIAALTVAPWHAVTANDLQPEIREARGLMKAFAEELQANLKSAMQAGGPVNAIRVCQAVAPEIGERHSAGTPWDIGRTSLRVRNPANAPDAWERAVLERFERRREAGVAFDELVHAEVVETDQGVAQVRVMKAIPTREVCLGCHGSDLAPEVTARLEALYPQDQATGFAVGEIRGAFTLTRPR